MGRRIFYTILMVFSIGYVSECSGVTFTVNGLSYSEVMYGDIKTKNVEIFSDYSLSESWGGTITGHVGEYYYAEGGTQSGWIDLKNYKGGKTIEIRVPTYTQGGSGTMTFRLMGRLGDSGDGVIIYDYVLVGSGTTIMLVEGVDWGRIGVNISVIGTESVNVKLKADSAVPYR